MGGVVTWLAASGAWACIAGMAAGAVSMLIYRELSPQDRLRRLADELAKVRKQLSTYEGDFPGAMALSCENLRLSFERLGYALWPAMGSSIPVVVGLPAIGDRFATYFLAVFATALVAKLQFKIA